MAKTTNFETVNESAAGIDLGSEKIFVSPDGEEVVSFDTFSSGYEACLLYLKSKSVTKVAMEATGVYWMVLYAMLEKGGIQVCLVNPKEQNK